LPVQAQIVSEIEALEAKEAAAKERVESLKRVIHDKIAQKAVQGKVSDLCSLSTEKIAPIQFPEKDFIYLGLEHIESDSGKVLSKNIQKGIEIHSAKNVFQKGDILFGRLRPYLNKVTKAAYAGICSTEIFVLKTDVPLLLKYILLSEEFVKQTTSLMKGISLPRIKKESFLRLNIPLPPLPEQQKIVAEIEALEAEITAAEAELTGIPAQKAEVLRKYLN
jgi:restriction endonuclease S subunit